MKFRTGFTTFSDEVEKYFLKGKYFNIHFEKEISKKVERSAYEIIIEADNERKAQQAFELLIASISLEYGYSFYEFQNLPEVRNYEINEITTYSFENYKNSVEIFAANFFNAAKICCKASFRKKYYISIYKYYLASCIHSNYLNDLDPTRREYYKQSKNPLDHIRYANAILIFYTIIEELQIEIRASNKNPSKIKDEWNPVVLEDLLERIKNEKINPELEIYWDLRYKPTNIQKSDKLKIGDKANWAFKNVRDSQIKLVDAISYISWLRSKIVAHKLNDNFMSISIYDVANVNMLIRKILMDILNK